MDLCPRRRRGSRLRSWLGRTKVICRRRCRTADWKDALPDKSTPTPPPSASGTKCLFAVIVASTPWRNLVTLVLELPNSCSTGNSEPLELARVSPRLPTLYLRPALPRAPGQGEWLCSASLRAVPRRPYRCRFPQAGEPMRKLARSGTSTIAIVMPGVISSSSSTLPAEVLGPRLRPPSRPPRRRRSGRCSPAAAACALTARHLGVPSAPAGLCAREAKAVQWPFAARRTVRGIWPLVGMGVCVYPSG